MWPFRRRKDEPVDPDGRSPQLGVKYKDLALMGQLMDAGADLSEPRHVVYYLYASSQPGARAMAQEAEGKGFTAEARPPLPEYPDQWGVVCQTTTVLSPEFVRDSTDFFEALAQRHGAEYDGWEAAV